MQPKRLFVVSIIIFCCFCHIGIAEQQNDVSSAISFQKTDHDFGKIGTGTKQTYQFEFENTGSDILKIGKVKSTCGCTVPTLSKTEYLPNEEGSIEVTYSAPGTPSEIIKSIYVSTNDPNNSNVQLTIKASVINLITSTPEKLQLLLKKENAATSDIYLKSINDQKFSIKNINLPNSIQITFDPNISSNEFILKPKIDMEKLQENPQGNIRIEVEGISCSPLTIPYELLSEFKTDPIQVSLLNLQPQEVIYKQLSVISNYNEDFEIESVSSNNGYI